MLHNGPGQKSNHGSERNKTIIPIQPIQLGQDDSTESKFMKISQTVSTAAVQSNTILTQSSDAISPKTKQYPPPNLKSCALSTTSPHPQNHQSNLASSKQRAAAQESSHVNTPPRRTFSHTHRTARAKLDSRERAPKCLVRVTRASAFPRWHGLRNARQR